MSELDLIDSGPFSMVEKDMRGNITVGNRRGSLP
jgi:hypothetical protein